MKTQRITELANLISNSDTTTLTGRQTIANSCKEFYSIIEEDLYKAEREWMLNGMYNDLCNGNFAEPFMCEQIKSTFITILEIYNKRVVPYIN